MAEQQGGGGLLGRLWDTVSGFFVAMFQNVWAGFSDFWTEHVLDKIVGLWDWLNTADDGAWNAMFSAYVRSGLFTEAQKARLMSLKDIVAPLNFVALIFVTIFLYVKTLIIELTSGMSFAQQALNKDLRPNLPGYGEILRSALIAPEKTGEIREIAKRSGIPDPMIDLLFLSLYRATDEGTIARQWLRGVIDDDKLFERMRELGYTDTRINEIIQTWSVIPSPQDLFYMVGKEAFEPDMIAKLGLAEEFPEEQVAWLEMQGVSRQWALRYWYAHWDAPSIGQGYEMLHRGVINEQELDMLFREIEMPSFWRDKLTKISYNPYTRVDVRRMHKLGILGVEDVYKSYLDQGYDAAHALNMTRFTVEYNEGDNKELTKAEILGGYADKVISREDAKILLLKLDYNSDQAEYILTYEDFKELKDLRELEIKNVQDRFQAQLIDKSTARSMLNSLNLPAVQTEALLSRWEISTLASTKMPSKTDLDKFLSAGIIDLKRYETELTKLGYNSEYTNWYVNLKGGTENGS